MHASFVAAGLCVTVRDKRAAAVHVALPEGDETCAFCAVSLVGSMPCLAEHIPCMCIHVGAALLNSSSNAGLDVASGEHDETAPTATRSFVLQLCCGNHVNATYMHISW